MDAAPAEFEKHNSDTEDAQDRRRIGTRSLAVFEDRYGEGSFDRLTIWLMQPCVTFAEIAERFGVTRERVRQWHGQFLPDAPTGRARQRECAVHQQRRRLFKDPLFRTFFQHARPHFGSKWIQPIRARDGYRHRSVFLDGHLVALRDMRASGVRPLRFRGQAKFVYFLLGETDYLLVPVSAISGRGVDRRAGIPELLLPYYNTFVALREFQERSAS